MTPSVARVLVNLANVHRAGREHEESETLFKRAVEMLEPAWWAHRDVGVTFALNGLGFLYEEQGRYAEAEPVYPRSLQMREEVLGPNHPEVATVCNNLAQVYRGRGMYVEAEPLYQRALMILEQAERTHELQAVTLQNYAQMLRDTGHETQAAELEARAHDARSRACTSVNA